ncbi:MAG: hypothetical protein GY699_05815 [Desulfobacteraceae bacterium]|nr:hypothetical protein [Desulfobacteraceae bacterium]
MEKIKFVGADGLNLSIGWSNALLLLSLDLLGRYWSEFGLDFKDHDSIRGLIREHIEAEQALRDLSEEEYHFSMESDLVNDLFKKITNTNGDLIAKKIRDWIEKRLLVQSRDRWCREMRYMIFRSVGDKDFPIVTGIGIDKLAALDNLAEKMADINDQIEPEIDKLEKEPKSEWDLRQYAIYQKVNPAYSPLDALSGYLNYWRFIDGWNEILILLTPDELNALELWAKAVSMAKKRNPDYLTIPPEYRHPE